MSGFTPENFRVTAMLGNFVVLWSIYDTVLDAGIKKQLRLSAEEGAIVTSGLAHERKVSILKSLLALHGSKYEEATAAITKIAEVARRNVLMHGNTFVSNDSLLFVKLDTENKLKARSHIHNQESIKKSLLQISELLDLVQASLGISEAERMEIPNIGKSLAAKKA